jgi:hypothetical protein
MHFFSFGVEFPVPTTIELPDLATQAKFNLGPSHLQSSASVLCPAFPTWIP